MFEKKSYNVSMNHFLFKRIKKYNTNLCLGIDKSDNKDIQTINNLKEEIACVKFNLAFHLADIKNLQKLIKHCKKLKIPVIVDLKINDVTHTNKEWIIQMKKLDPDYITISPFPQNIKETIKFSHSKGIGAIVLGAMSDENFQENFNFKNQNISYPVSNTMTAIKSNCDGLVVGAINEKNKGIKNHIQYLQKLSKINSKNLFYLIPGVGSQKGNLELTLKNLKVKDRKFLVNVGRDIMNKKDKLKAAQKINKNINKLL